MPNFEAAYFDQKAVEELLELSGQGGGKLIVELVDLYSRTSPELLKKIEDAFAHEDSLAIQQHAHSLKSSSAALGLLQLHQRCAFLEKNTEQLLQSGRAQFVLDLQVCFQRSLAILQNFVSRQRAA